MIHLEYIDRARQRSDGAGGVHALRSADLRGSLPGRRHQADRRRRGAVGAKPRCIACGNCVVACPFGVPEVYEDRKLMMKCDMCYDRTSIGKKPMCATVCPSQALFYGTAEEIERLRPMSTPANRFQFGATITTRVFVMSPRGPVTLAPLVRHRALADRAGIDPFAVEL